ncbi:hypothetical protein Cni_G05082 [Canna indica]|uniref:DUF4283 domain-containing protein n=1 Tax=Canna indica TaxID=4628 RepID=A0AAQ3Q2V7_9LILI|nr:hypothetical protein Cni_G05082 [Canna indica]
MPWKANFQPFLEKIETILVWIQFPGLSIEYLNKGILLKLAAKVGQPVKFDEVTTKGLRARYPVAFENIPKLYYSCEKMSHMAENSSETNTLKVQNVMKESNGKDTIMSSTVDDKINGVDGLFGPWQLVNIRRRNGGQKREQGKMNLANGTTSSQIKKTPEGVVNLAEERNQGIVAAKTLNYNNNSHSNDMDIAVHKG